MRRTRNAIAGVMLALLMTVGLGMSASASEVAPDSVAAPTTVGASGFTVSPGVTLTEASAVTARGATQRWAICGTTNWGSKNPKTCKSSYTVYDWNSAMQRPVIKFQVTNGTNIWPYVAKGYKATQDWCSKNSLTCGIITSVGVTIVAGWIQAATG